MMPSFAIETPEQQVYTNDKKGWKSLSNRLGVRINPKEESVHCTMEATGVYHEGVAHHLHEQKFIVHIVLPNQSKSYGKSLGIKSKTDKIDARTLSVLGLERVLREWSPPSKTLVNLKQLTRERERLVCMQTALKNNLHGSEYPARPCA
jgi:transposase